MEAPVWKLHSKDSKILHITAIKFLNTYFQLQYLGSKRVGSSVLVHIIHFEQFCCNYHVYFHLYPNLFLSFSFRITLRDDYLSLLSKWHHIYSVEICHVLAFFSPPTQTAHLFMSYWILPMFFIFSAYALLQTHHHFWSNLVLAFLLLLSFPHPWILQLTVRMSFLKKWNLFITFCWLMF